MPMANEQESRTGRTDKELEILLEKIRLINQLTNEGYISPIERLRLHEILVPGIWDKDKALYMIMYRRKKAFKNIKKKIKN